jgi:putative tryptophan/tyrosine transport system substrate-binding protein
MNRRQFIAGLGSAATWPLAARAQQPNVPVVGVLWSMPEFDPIAKPLLSALTQGLADMGWTEGRNLRIVIRWAAGNVDRAGAYAKELVDLRPEVILADSTPQTAAFQRETSTIPIVFFGVSDPVGSGFVAGMPRPGGNITGFAYVEPSMGGKWLELLIEIAPSVKRVAAMFNPDTAPYVRSYYLPSFEGGAKSRNIEAISTPVRSDAEIEATIASLGREQGGGLVAMPDSFTFAHRETIISLAAQYKVPAVYFHSSFSRDGGLLSYATDPKDQVRRAAAYIDRILRGAKPADLPVQLPVKFEMVVNFKTAKALGLTVPQSILLRADEVIE